MKPEKLYSILHFYYCITVAIKIAKKYGEIKTCIQCNIFILKWLQNAVRKNIFGQQAASELNWLKKYIESQGPLFRHAELLIDNIYLTSVKLLRSGVSNHDF